MLRVIGITGAVGQITWGEKTGTQDRKTNMGMNILESDDTVHLEVIRPDGVEHAGPPMTSITQTMQEDHRGRLLDSRLQHHRPDCLGHGAGSEKSSQRCPSNVHYSSLRKVQERGGPRFSGVVVEGLGGSGPKMCTIALPAPS